MRYCIAKDGGHLAADALVPVGVVLAGIAILLTGWLWFDPVISLIIVDVIVLVLGTYLT